MVDVSEKLTTDREVQAEARILLSPDAFAAISEGSAPKGDVLAAARIAGIMAAKKTPELIPLYHPTSLANAEIDFELADDAIRIVARIKTNGPTGVEMEALIAASVAALTIYDMIKTIDKAARIEDIGLLAKSGGRSGNFAAPARKFQTEAPTARGRVKPATIMGDVVGPRPAADHSATREAFRAFMTSRHLRATTWAKDAKVPVGEVLSFLTGRSRGLSREIAERLARVAKVRVEDIFR